MGVKDRLIAYAREAGFAKVGVCRPDAVPEIADRLTAFVDAEMHGQMAWMAERMHWRGAPDALWPDARSVIMLAEPYTPDHDPLAVLEQADRAAISVYAQGRDYHDVVKKRLKRVGRWLIEQVPEAEIKVFVDTAPVMEKPLAQAAGVGWQGKHTNLLGRDLGSWFFLGAIFTTVALEPDTVEVSHCGSCTACLDIIYGCDDCLAVCPWNKFASTARDARYAARDDLRAPPLAELVALDDAAFRIRFSGSPIKRIGRDRFVRNVLYAIGNGGDPAMVGVLSPLVDDPDPAVADAARWAILRLQEDLT